MWDQSEGAFTMKWRILLAILAMGLTAVIGSAPASAQATRTWVSGVGDDVNPCSRTAPCKTFAGAISKTAAGGEINCLDPAGFGAVTITKSITIDCTGTLGGILASSTTGVIVNGAGIIVTLRALEINGGPPNLPGVNGVRYLQGARLNIEDSTIYNFLSASPNGNGIIINNTSGGARLHVRNSVIRNNSSPTSGAGIRVFPSGSGSANVTLENVSITGNFRGIDVNATATTAGITVVVSGGAIDHNADNAINVDTAANAVNLMIEGVQISNNLRGIITNGAGAQTRIGGSVITNNGTAVAANTGGTVLSFKNNQIEFNTNNSTPITQVQLQ
jgi:hypothetical protein